MTAVAPPDVTRELGLAARGDRDAFMAVYDLTCDVVYRVALCRSGDPAVAAQLTERAYVAAWSRIAEHRSSGLSPVAWLISLLEPASPALTVSISASAEHGGWTGRPPGTATHRHRPAER